MRSQVHSRATGHGLHIMWSDRAIIVIGIIALVSSSMLWWTNTLSRSPYPSHILLTDNLQQARRAVTQAIIFQGKHLAGEPVSTLDVFAALDNAALSVNDCIEGRSTLLGIASEKPPEKTVRLLHAYREAIVRLDRTVRALLLAGNNHEALQIQQFKEFHEAEQIAATIETAQAEHFTELSAKKRLEQQVGIGLWIFFLITAFCLLYRAARIESAQSQQEQLIHALLDSTPDAIFVKDRDGRYLICNEAAAKIIGKPVEEIIGRDDRSAFPAAVADSLMAIDREIMEAGVTRNHIEEVTTLDGNDLIFLVVKGILYNPKGHITGLFGISRDITDQRRAEAERERLQEQLLQAQKMESVGRLAGGVAHDFNNMLGVILGYTEIAQENVDPSDQLYNDLQEIKMAAERSVNLTRQLLAFARKQTIAPRALDLNDAVAGMLTMVRRLIGEDIDLAWIPGANLWPVNVDPSQVDQLLANLCVNARDAITGIGRVTIETSNISFNEDYCAEHPGFVSGEFVLLALSDNGCGMDKETMSHLYEPFFTTKEMGKGTGLGLATIYGIVKQNSGHINVYSEPGRGTTVKLYLPRHQARDEPSTLNGPSPSSATGDETILLVEDERSILSMTATLLERLGYSVLAANSPSEACSIAKDHVGKIHMVMTDVIMPEMNGRELAEKLSSICPGLRCLFMSGYTANVIAHHGVLDEDVYFIQKPFSKTELSLRVRELLDKPGPIDSGE